MLCVGWVGWGSGGTQLGFRQHRLLCSFAGQLLDTAVKHTAHLHVLKLLLLPLARQLVVVLQHLLAGTLKLCAQHTTRHSTRSTAHSTSEAAANH